MKRGGCVVACAVLLAACTSTPPKAVPTTASPSPTPPVVASPSIGEALDVIPTPSQTAATERILRTASVGEGQAAALFRRPGGGWYAITNRDVPYQPVAAWGIDGYTLRSDGSPATPKPLLIQDQAGWGLASIDVARRGVDGSILVMLARDDSGLDSSVHVRRVNARGVLDLDYAKRHGSVRLYPTAPSRMTVLPDGSARLCISVDAPGNETADLFGLEPDGARDRSVGADGLRRGVTPEHCADIMSTPDGRLLRATTRGKEGDGEQPERSVTVVTRLLPNGDPDPAFPSETVLEVKGHSLMASTIKPARDGGIFVSGDAYESSTGGEIWPFVARLLPNGAPDPSFGTDGIVMIDTPWRRAGSLGFEVTAEGDPLIIVTTAIGVPHFDRQTPQGNDPAHDFESLIYRLDEATGAIDRSFGRAGVLPVNGRVARIIEDGANALVVLATRRSGEHGHRTVLARLTT